MKTIHLSPHQPGCFAGALAVALGLLFAAFFPASAAAATQSNACETVLTYGTGTSPTGAKLRLGSVDPFFVGTSANFPDRGAAYVVTNPPAVWIANSGSDDSQWIGPSPDVSDDAAGTYVYRLQFTTPCAGASVTGRYAAADRGVLRLNGAAVSFPTPATGYNVWTAFSFASLPVGVNTLEFYVTNSPSAFGPPGPTGLRAELTVTATCCPCIELTCPPDIYLTTCFTGATANFSIAGTNRCFTNLTITCTYGGVPGIPATTNTVFPPGTNIVACLARDTVGHTTNCSFRVVVTRDSRPPEIHCPQDIVYPCSVAGTNVYYNVTATDDTDANPVVTCVPPSGSYFPPGTNIVTCEARDACGRVSKCSFKVILAPNGFTKTLQAGIADNFLAGGFEAATAGPCLGASGFWSGQPFDASWPGRQMAQSFQGLPNNISAAKLILRMKPTQAASHDDVLRLGLQNCGAAGVWAFAQAVASLPDAGGTWNANPPTTFTLDLAALPGGLSLLADLNATHRLEFAVGTETVVDYARLEVTYCGPQSTLSGVPYSMSNVYPIHQGRGGVSWHAVNSNDVPALEFDAGGADGLRFDFVDPGFDIVSHCQTTPISQYHGLLMDWPIGEGTFARVGFNSAPQPWPIPDLTRISLNQIGNVNGKVVEVWNGSQFVSRYFVPGSLESMVLVPTSACLVQMGFTTAFYFAAFESTVPVIVGGQLVSGQAGPVTGTSVLLYYNITINANANEPKRVPVTLPPGGFNVSRMSLLHYDTWIDPFGPQLVSASDVVISKALTYFPLGPYGDCVNVGISGWNVELQNGLADFCEFDGQTVNCTPGHVDLTMYGMGPPEIKYGGLRLSLASSYPFDNCRIENTIPNAAPYSVVITRPAPASPITLNSVTNVETLHWPVKVSGGPGPQSWTVELPPNSTATAAGQTHAATHVTFLATPSMLDQFYRVCVQTVDALQITMKSLTVPPQTTPPPPPDCLTLTCPSNVVVTSVAYAIGTVVTFNPTATARCGSNVVITCVPPSGSVFAPGNTVVHCLASDSLGYHDRCSFLVTVRDGFPPHLSIPGRLVVPCDGPLGAVVNFTSGAQDNLDPSPVVDCDPPSGTLFPPGTNLVVCAATDAGGNRSSMSFPVIVGGGCGTNRCIDITVPAEITVPCRTPGGANVTFIATARNTCTGGTLAVTCAPASGSLFPVGLTRVVCTTTSGGSQSSATFLVEVTDIVPPQINCPSNIVAAEQSPLGAVVNYSVSATDDCTPSPRLRCSPMSGTVFPVGDTRVLCEAADGSGNVDRCVFVVTVRPPRPFTATQMEAGRVELRWVGEALVECTGTLDTGRWLRVGGTPTSNGVERALILPVNERQKFFRIVPLPVLPPADRDRDGVPDERDRCPDTPPGMPVDEFGCAPFDLVASPGLALGPEQAQLRKLRADLARWPSVADLADLVPNPDTHTSSVPALLIRRELPRALVEQSNVVRRLDRALMDFLRVKGRRLVEIDQTTPPLDAEHADWRHEDDEILDLERIEAALTDSLNQHQRAFLNLSNIVRATGSMPSSQRVQVASIDSVRGVATLTDGRRLLLPNPGTPAAPPFNSIRDAFDEGVEVDAETTQLPDGSLYGNFASSSTGVSGAVIQQANPRRLFLRVTPVDFGLPDFDTAPRHHLPAYEWGFTETSSRHYFEFGQAFAAVATLPLPGSGNYKHWLKIDEDSNNNGIYATLVQKLDAASKPFVLKADRLPQFQAFNIRVREYRAPVLPNGNLGIQEVVDEQVYLIELNPAGTYANAYYDQMAFTLDDSPSETRHRIARVTDIGLRFPLTLKPLNEMTFNGVSYKATGNSSSYPAVQPIGFNDPFAVHFQDPNANVFFANPDDLDKGIVHPTLSGHNRNRPFSYRTTLPFIARDRLHDCGGGNTFENPDTFYKIPFSGGYTVSQGNNGAFTHNGAGRYAWDFPKPAFTTVLAARGGIVIDLGESSSQSCYNSILGDCFNCTGAASGNFVKIRHRDGAVSRYFHFRQNGVLVSLNQRVYRGTPLGLVGTTGCSTGNHLHFDVKNPDIGTITIPARFEAFALPSFSFEDCFVPPANSAGVSTQ